MNPLDMMGPDFLLFYLLYGVAGLFLVLQIKARRDADTPAGRWMPGQYPREEDAYHLALLRDGSRGVATTLLARLVSCGLAAVEGDTIQASPLEPDRQRGLLPLERTALAALPVGVQVAEDVIAAAVQPQIATLRDDLTREGLMPNLEQTQASRRLLSATLLAIPGLGVLKLIVALARGRTNIFFLILMILGYTVVTAVLLRLRNRTAAGERYLAWLRDSHRGLLHQVQDGRSDVPVGVPMGLALAAGIYGLAAVPQMMPLEQALHPRRPQDTSGGGCSSSGCGSDSGGGGGDGGGSGCGGCGGGD